MFLTGFCAVDYLWCSIGLIETYFVKIMYVCTLRVGIYWLMQINSRICQHKQKKSGNEHVTVILSQVFLNDFYILTLLNVFLQDYVVRDSYSEYLFLALPVQHIKRMFCIMLSYFSYLAVTYFSKLSEEYNSFQKKFIEQNCVFQFVYKFVRKLLYFKEQFIEIPL